jgi:membrane-associated phospholipid phosphatase
MHVQRVRFRFLGVSLVRARARSLVRVVVMLFLSADARAANECPVLPWHHLGLTGSELVRPLPLALGSGALLAPLAMAPTGLDHELRVLAQEDLGGSHDLEPVSVLAPYVLGGGVLVGYVASVGAAACDVQRPQAAMLQAMVLSVGSTVVLKIAVGREWPNAGLDPDDPERLEHPERAEHFTPFRTFGSWPSGHASFMFAAASAFRTSTPDFGVASWLGYPLALGVAAGMWIGDHHWASDIISGALLGEALGSSVGYGFSGGESREALRFGVLPAPEGTRAPAGRARAARSAGALLYAAGTW